MCFCLLKMFRIGVLPLMFSHICHHWCTAILQTSHHSIHQCQFNRFRPGGDPIWSSNCGSSDRCSGRSGWSKAGCEQEKHSAHYCPLLAHTGEPNQQCAGETVSNNICTLELNHTWSTCDSIVFTRWRRCRGRCVWETLTGSSRGSVRKRSSLIWTQLFSSISVESQTWILLRSARRCCLGCICIYSIYESECRGAIKNDCILWKWKWLSDVFEGGSK